MANVQIPNLPAATSISGAEQVEIVQAGTSVRTTTGQIAGIAVTSASEAAASAAAAAASAVTATTQAGTATTQASTATAQAIIATTQAGIATTQAGTATTQAGIATTQAGLAATARVGAETARDAAFVNANVYPDTATGLAATTNGQQFQVVAGGEIIRYSNNSGSAVEVARYPKGGFLRYMGLATTGTTPEVATNNVYLTSTPGTYTNFSALVVNNEIAQLRYTGSAWVKDTVYSFDNQRSVGSAVYGAVYPITTTGGSTYTFTVVAGTTIDETYGTGGGTNCGQFTLSAQTLEIPTNDNYSYIYATRAGVLGYAASINAVPVGGVLLFYKASIYVHFQSLIPSNHQFGGTFGNRDCIPIPVDTFNFKSLGAQGNGVSDDSVFYALLGTLVTYWFTSSGALYWAKNKPPVTIYFPTGTYLFDPIRPDARTKWLGDGKTATILRSYSEAAFAFGKSANHFCENIGFHNVPAVPSGASDFVYHKNVRFTWTADVTGGSTYCGYGAPKDAGFENVDFDFLGTVYAGLWLYDYNRVVVKDCTFATSGTGIAYHNLRLADPLTSDASAEISRNTVYNGTTGIFLGSNRTRPTQNVLIERNYLYRQTEESISLDGFGNNYLLVPTICNGPITAVSNDANGRLVVRHTMTYATNNAGAQSTYTVASRNDWTNFYLSFGEGSGLEGVYARIFSYDAVNDTLTCDLYTAAASVTIGGDCGVQSGFFQCIVRDNVIQGSVGSGQNTACALSIYLNVFGTRVENNTIIGCHQGVLICGGLMLSTYRTLAYNNVVSQNTFLACGQVAGGYPTVRFESLYGGSKQYGNMFVNNFVKGGRVYLENQQNFNFKDNVIDGATATLKYLGNTLPPADASQVNRTFMKVTDNGSGDPTAIEYYVCKLSGGTYSWAAV